MEAWERIERGNQLLRCRLQARSARRREALRRPERKERGGAHCGGHPRTACSSCFSFLFQGTEINIFPISISVVDYSSSFSVKKYAMKAADRCSGYVIRLSLPTRHDGLKLLLTYLLTYLLSVCVCVCVCVSAISRG